MALIKSEKEENPYLRENDFNEEESHITDATMKKLYLFMRRTNPLIDQINQNYRAYVQGVEDFLPRVKRGQLDELMKVMTNLPKSTPQSRFRYVNLQQKFIAFRDKWDRLVKDLESG